MKIQVVPRIIVIQVSLILVLYSFANAQNLIQNPGFEEGNTGWAFNKNNGANANFTIETLNSPEGSKHLNCVVISLGTNDWDLQVRSNEFAVDQTHKYRLTFKAKSEIQGAEIKVYIQKSTWMGKNFTLSDSWTTYTYEFFPNESIKELKFNFVKVTKYYIDDIVIEDVTPDSNDYNTPPSCVITAPHVNAYYKKESTVTINAYATDIGGSGIAGEISKVEFFIDNGKIGEATTAANKVYSYKWNADNIGEYHIKAIATDNLGKSFTSAGVLISVGTNNVEETGLSAGKGKYLGNVVRNSGVESSFTTYWNAVTSGNGGKWQTVEAIRDVMNWEKADEAYQFADNNNLAYRYHTTAWGSQYPDWIKTLPPSEFQVEMEQFIKAISERYPYIDQIDVINEPLPGHQEDTKYFIDGLGGAGVSGYDWAVWLFKKAREYFPDSKLILNDFNMVNSTNNIREQLLLLKVLRDSALVDGFGAQGHTFSLDNMQASNLKNNLDLMATAGVPIYITEMDMQGTNTDEASQLTSYQNLFPVLWEHPDVAGITLWGYIYGNMWKPDAGLVYENGTERLSMVWLKDYMENQEEIGYPFSNGATLSAEPGINETKNLVKIYPNPAQEQVTLFNNSNNTAIVSVFDSYGRLITNLEIGANSKVELNLPTGMYLVKINNKNTIKLIVKG